MTVRRRIASDEASTWARKLVLGDALAKYVLRSAALYVDDHGLAAVSLESLSDDTELSIATVRRKLRWLEQIGAVTLIDRWIDENGRVNYEKRGKQTFGQIRLEVDADVMDIAMKAGDVPLPRTKREKAEQENQPSRSDTPAEQPLNAVSPPAAGVTLESPPYSCLESTLKNKKEPPQTPPKQGGLSEATDKRFEEFKSGYPDAILDPDKAKAMLGSLSEPDQIAAVTSLPHYADYLRRRKQNSVKGHIYLKKRMWEAFTGAQASAAATSSVVPFDSRAAKALTVACRILGMSSPPRCSTGYVCSAPITPQLLALADAPPESEWLIWESGTQSSGAWRGLRDLLPQKWGMPRLERIRAPWRFPPRIDGTLSPTGPSESTGPPQSLMTADDERALTDGL